MYIKQNLLRAPFLPICTLVGSAIVVSLFYRGLEITLFALTMALLLSWLLITIWRSFDHGIAIPKNPILILLTGFSAWLIVTVFWSPVPYLSVFNVWWLSVMPLVFWIYTLTRERQQLLPVLGIIVLFMGCSLAIYALIQNFVLEQQPRSVFLNINLHAALLNIIIIPLAAYLLRSSPAAKAIYWGRIALWTGLFVLIYAVALSNSRGAGLSLLLGLVLLSIIVRKAAPGKIIIGIFTIAIMASIAAAFSWQYGAGSRLLSYVATPLSTDTGRLVIWDAGWKLVQSAPILGNGLGMFALLYPPLRAPMDQTTGYFVHNDYLQIWIEAGLPALLLIFLILLITLWKFIVFIKNNEVNPGDRIEATGWFAALATVAIHNVVTFNSYVVTTMILSGLMLGRLSQLFDRYDGVRYWLLKPGRYLSKPVYRVIIVILLLFPLTYFGSIILAITETDRAHAFAKQGRLDKADKSLHRAARFYPYADNILITHADLYRHVITVLPRAAKKEKEVLYRRALKLLIHAEGLNPLRPLNYLVRAQLFQQNPALTGRGWQTMAAQSYRHALALNPRYFHARLAYASMLLKNGQRRAAREILEQGMQYWYADTRHVIPYLLMTAKLRREMGDKAGAKQLLDRIRLLAKTTAWRRAPQSNTDKRLTIPGKPANKPVTRFQLR